MQADKELTLKRALLLLEELPVTSRLDKAMRLILEELDENGPTQEELTQVAAGMVEEIKPAKDGSYVLQKVKCGDPSCHCSKNPGDYHGPYWYLFIKKNGKTRSKYIGKHLPPKAV